MRIMGLDMGTKTIGIAISDALLLTAQGVEVIRRTSEKADIARIGELITEYEVHALVLGWPRHMNGSVGERAIAAEAFAELLRAAFPDCEVLLWDERLSTVAANRSLLEADVSRKKRKQVIDKMAAVYILQGYLDSAALRNKRQL